MRRISRAAPTTIVSLTRTDGKRFTRLGTGAAHAQRVLDAYAQLPPGEYVVDCVSTPGTVYSDIVGRDEMLHDHENQRVRTAMQRYEGKTVVIA